MSYEVLKYLHVLGAIIILGTGTGIAFFMLMAHLSKDVGYIAQTAKTVVIADFLFTASAVILQPITGYLLAEQVGLELFKGWVAWSLALYVVAGLFWLPVVFIQARMSKLASAAYKTQTPLPPAYHNLFRIWFLFGIPGFGSVMAIVWLMVAKPVT